MVTQAIDTYSSRGQGIVVVPFILSGAMGPVSTAASVTQAMAEALMCCAFSQLIRPGAPFVLGNFLSSMSLKSGAPTFGMPEPILSNYVLGQMAPAAGLPLRCGASLTARTIEVAQAAYASDVPMCDNMLARTTFVLLVGVCMHGRPCDGFSTTALAVERHGGCPQLWARFD